MKRWHKFAPSESRALQKYQLLTGIPSRSSSDIQAVAQYLIKEYKHRRTSNSPKLGYCKDGTQTLASGISPDERRRFKSFHWSPTQPRSKSDFDQSTVGSLTSGLFPIPIHRVLSPRRVTEQRLDIEMRKKQSMDREGRTMFARAERCLDLALITFNPEVGTSNRSLYGWSLWSNSLEID
jgi:hypothetical protein